MAKGPHPLRTALTLRVPLWAAVLPVVLLVLGAVSLREKAAGERAQLLALQAEARRLALELEAERSRNQAYSAEAAQLQQSLGILERELNRLRARAGLPEVRLGPIQPSPPSSEAPRGAGEPVELGSLLLSLRTRMDNLSLELEATARSLDNPTPPDPWPKPTRSNRTPRGLPLPFEARLTSGFGYRPSPFGTLAYEFHNGVDLAAPEGTPVYATAAGTASQVGWNPLFGLMVLLDHGNGLHTLYGHLSAAYVARGQTVEEGQPIGAVGSTGGSTGPHLHYTVYRYGVAVDPLPYLR